MNYSKVHLSYGLFNSFNADALTEACDFTETSDLVSFRIVLREVSTVNQLQIKF